MARRYLGSGLLVLLTLGLLTACGADPLEPPTANSCNWPDTCALTVRQMFDEIAERARAAPPDEIDDPDREMILQRIELLLSPDLSKKKVHVCDLKDPLPTFELTKIWERTDEERLPDDIAARPGHWHTIATDLENFPTGM